MIPSSVSWQRCTSARLPKRSRIAFRSALLPSMMKRYGRCGSGPRSTRLSSSCPHTWAFSLPPSHIPSGCFRPFSSMPSATSTVCSQLLSPSSISATSESADRSRESHASSLRLVVRANRRLAALLLAPWLWSSSGNGSIERA